jgi:hypothetical protein
VQPACCSVATGASQDGEPGRASLGLVCTCCRVHSAVAMARGGGNSLPHGCVVAAHVLVVPTFFL